MKTYALLAAFFAMTALAAPAVDQPTKVIRHPTKVLHRRFYGQQFCDCINDCMAANSGSGGEGGLGLGMCESGCYDYPTPTAGTCEELGD